MNIMSRNIWYIGLKKLVFLLLLFLFSSSRLDNDGKIVWQYGLDFFALLELQTNNLKQFYNFISKSSIVQFNL